MTNRTINIITGAGFHAGVAALNLIAKQQQETIKQSDTEFPSFTISFQNNLSIDFKGFGHYDAKLKDTDLLLCYSLNKPFSADPRTCNLFNPHWYARMIPKKQYLALASRKTCHFKAFNPCSFKSTIIYPDETLQGQIDLLIEAIALQGLCSAVIAQTTALIDVLQSQGFTHLLLGCTEFLVVSHLFADFESVHNPVIEMFKEVL